MHKQSLIKKLKNKSAIIGVIGLGYVGLPLFLRYAEVGYKVIGFDVDEKKISNLKNSSSYIQHISSDLIAHALNKGSIVTTDFSMITQADALIICVPTPLNKYREPDLSFVTDTIDLILPYLRKEQVLSLESTTYPGTTDEVLKPRLESVEFKVGEDLFLVYSPEREDPGNLEFNTSTIPKVCGGFSPDCLDVGIALYENVIKEVVPVSSTRAAEMTKLLENIHRSVNIGLVNEMKIVADKMNIDIHEVIRAAATKPFGYVPYYPGPGLGGHCIPIDPFYLTWKAREFGLHTRFIELAGEVNSSMPDFIISKVISGLNNQKKPISGSKILVLGIAYKKNVDDMRESPSVVLMSKLRDFGAVVEYSDPHIANFPKMRDYFFDLSSVIISEESLARYDCVLLATDHDAFDYDLIKNHSKLIIDSRGKFLEPQSHIIKA